MTTNVRSASRVTLTIEVPGSTYGQDWTIKDIVAQAKREVPGHVVEKLRSSFPGVKLIGEPVVSVVCVLEDK